MTAYDAQRRAELAVAAMWAEDQASQGLGMTLVEVSPGRARMRMTVTAAMVNGHGICHGGFVFALADSAFAFACNSHNRSTVAQAADVVFVAPARLGDVLEAEADERTLFGRNGIYDVTVRDTGTGAVVAEFRGRSRRIAGTLVPEEDPDA
jgi:acyl-CoA thioesterase